MATVREFTFPSSDGIHAVHAMEWRPEEAPRAVVQIVHGVSEYVGRYDAFARFLADHGFVVCGEDHLGHGKTASDGVYGYFGKKDGWKHVISDVRCMRERMGEQWPGLPYFLFGHSMGSFLTRTYLIRWPGTVSAAILSGTGQESPFLLALGSLICKLACKFLGPTGHSSLVYNLSLGAYNKQFKPNRTSADWICRDEAVVDALLGGLLTTGEALTSLLEESAA